MKPKFKIGDKAIWARPGGVFICTVTQVSIRTFAKPMYRIKLRDNMTMYLVPERELEAIYTKLDKGVHIMKKLIYFISAVVILVSLSSCGKDSMDTTEHVSGKVIEKNFYPAHATTKPVPQVIFSGKYATTVLVHETKDYPAMWCIVLQEYDGETEKYDTSEWVVSQTVYNSLSVGDWYEYSPD